MIIAALFSRHPVLILIASSAVLGADSRHQAQFQSVVLANPEVADKVRFALLPSIPLFASVGGAGGGFLGFLSPACGASA